MEWLGVVVMVAAVLAAAIALLLWRDRRRGPVCPHCGQPSTFGHDGAADVCASCGFDFRTDDY
jgi:NADH pyrophosphatase NudC (nudix superfamily)